MSPRTRHLHMGSARFDPDVAGGWTFGILAKKGAGKTYTGRVMAEEMWAAGIPFAAMGSSTNSALLASPTSATASSS